MALRGTNFLRKAWDDPVWSQVIVVGIIGVLTLAGNFLLKMDPLSFLTQELTLPIWAFVLIIFVLIVFLAVIVRSLSSKKFKILKGDEFDPNQHSELIQKAVLELRGITSFNLVWTGIRNDTNFLEFCINDFSETWLIQELPSTELNPEIRRQIKIVNRHLANTEARHKYVKIILFVYQKLSEAKKSELFHIAQMFQNTEKLSNKILFEVWDSSNIEKALGS